MTLNIQTAFIDNAIAIDPPDCRCTDCCVGDAIPCGDMMDVEELAEQVLTGYRDWIGRSGLFLELDAVNRTFWPSEPTPRNRPNRSY
ncbi:hypothetical protein [Nocardia sp. NPDC052566]|uniref:hypothetical protein n=1 Tax=Nocardia sp. NPDC052566 TaxID=3364330 RepID=UPI0037C6AC08